jgi:hypothetical protein
MKTQVLFRRSTDTEEEFAVANRHFKVVEQRSRATAPLVIGRYSVLPFYKELEIDLANVGSRLINSWRQHKFVADFTYYDEIEDITPKTYWDGTMSWVRAPEGQYVVKGTTNSRKHSWNTLMYAKTKRRAIQIGADLAGDDLIAQQGIIYRQFVPLKVFEVGINELPFSNEWRCFFLGDKLLSYGYYWSSASESVIQSARISPKGIGLAREAAARLSPYINFFAVDVAETVDGTWTVIEVNDGQMAGISENNPETLYENLARYAGDF